MKTISEHRPVCLDEDFDIFRPLPDYEVRVERGRHFLLTLSFPLGQAGARFTHPNIARSVPDTLHYKYDNPKRWVSKPGITHYLAVARRHITLLPEQGWSYPHARIDGCPVRFNVSGGTDGSRWVDSLRLRADVAGDKTALSAVAAIADRGTGWEPIVTPAEAAEAFYTRHAHDWLVNSAFGDWQNGVPAGMVGCVATVGGGRNPSATAPRRFFLVPQSEYARRTEQFVIDPQRHQEIADFTHLGYKR